MHGGFAYITWTVADIDRFQTFWTQLFGWEFSKGSAGGYHVVNANVPLGVRSGIVSRTDPDTLFTFAVTNMHRAVAQVRELGGIAGNPTGDARWNTADCRDDQGIPFTLWEPSPGGEFQFDAMWTEQQKAFNAGATPRSVRSWYALHSNSADRRTKTLPSPDPVRPDLRLAGHRPGKSPATLGL